MDDHTAGRDRRVHIGDVADIFAEERFDVCGNLVFRVDQSAARADADQTCGDSYRRGLDFGLDDFRGRRVDGQGSTGRDAGILYERMDGGETIRAVLVHPDQIARLRRTDGGAHSHRPTCGGHGNRRDRRRNGGRVAGANFHGAMTVEHTVLQVGLRLREDDVRGIGPRCV